MCIRVGAEIQKKNPSSKRFESFCVFNLVVFFLAGLEENGAVIIVQLLLRGAAGIGGLWGLGEQSTEERGGQEQLGAEYFFSFLSLLLKAAFLFSFYIFPSVSTAAGWDSDTQPGPHTTHPATKFSSGHCTAQLPQGGYGSSETHSSVLAHSTTTQLALGLALFLDLTSGDSDLPNYLLDP